ncbi:MAG TPA: cytochrome c oxidase subunit II [Chitinophagales bacterium]|nr:cytochrome c oxidase subunit II [Chitinophagales bacterium]HRK26683.1 cytochrome c oxidase subunit II [Chitinophagales bacterium]
MLTTTLGLLIIALVLLIVFQIAKTNELVTALKGEQEVQNVQNRFHGAMFLGFLIVGMIAAVWSAFHYAPLYLPYPSSEHGAWIRSMFFWTLVATVPVFILTHIALFWFSFQYKRDGSRTAFYFPGSNKLELIWTAIPAVVMILLVYEGLRSWYKITGPAPQEAMVVEATAQQFFWTLRYGGNDNKIGNKSVKLIGGDNSLGLDWEDSANHDDFIADELHLKVGQPVLVKISAIDVLHSFYLPHFRVKMDAVPGIPTQFWFTPTKTTKQMREELNNPDFNYELACAELCGQAHFNMRKVVVVEDEADFNAWKAQQQALYVKLGLNNQTQPSSGGTGSADEQQRNTETEHTKTAKL